MYAKLTALRESTADGAIARALAGIEARFDDHGNILAGDTRLGPGVRVRNSVLIDARIDDGDIDRSVLVGTRCGRVIATRAFDVQSTACGLRLAPRSGSYKVIESGDVQAGPGERVTTVFMPGEHALLRVHEDTDLRDRERYYDVPILGNPLSFAEAHARVTAADPAELLAARAARRRAIETALDDKGS